MPDPAGKRSYLLLPHPSRVQLLLNREETSLSLPFIVVPSDADLLDVDLTNRQVREQLGVHVTTLHSMHCYNRPEPPVAVFTLENHDPGWQPPDNLDWFGQEVLETHAFHSPLQKSTVVTWFEEQKLQRPFLPWWQAGWMAEAKAWINDRLQQSGLTVTAPIEQRKSWYFSAVLRVPTVTGDLYFKAVPHYMQQEIALTKTLPDWNPAHIPEAPAVDGERLWMLTRDMNGRSLEEVRTITAWGAALRDYANLQHQTTTRLAELLAMGCPDLRLHRLPERSHTLFAALPGLLDGVPGNLTADELNAVRSLSPQIDALCAQAAQYNIPAALVHGDFHGINVVRTADRTLFFDWGDACISHPFFDALELLSSDDWLPAEENAYTTLRDIYLEQWTTYEPMERLQELYALLKPLWALAMSFRHEKALHGMEAVCPLASRLPCSCALWATQQQQYWIVLQMRALLQTVADAPGAWR